MAISRLLLPKPAFYFHARGFPISASWYSSTSSSSGGGNEKSSQLKRSEAAKEKRAEAVESYVKKYMQEHPGVFPKQTHVQNKVGGSWYTLKHILTTLKEKMVGNTQVEDKTDSDAPHSTVDSATSESIMTQDSLQATKPREPQSILQSSEGLIDNHSRKGIASTTEALHTLGKSSSGDEVDTSASEAVKIHVFPDNIKPTEPRKTLQASKAEIDFLSNEKKFAIEGDQKVESKHVSFITRQLLDEVSKTSQKGDETKLTLAGNGNHQLEKQTVGSSQTIKMPFASSDRISRDKEVENFGIQGFIASIMGIHEEQSIQSQDSTVTNATAQISNSGIKRNPSATNVKGNHVTGKKNERKERPSEGIPLVSEPSTQAAFPIREELNLTPDVLFKEEGPTEKKALVRFLRNGVDKSDIISAFHDCGQVLKINEVNSVKGSYFKDIFVSFKTKEELQRAIKKTDMVVKDADVIVEATSLENKPNRILVPNLIGDPKVPVALVKNPARTVKIKQLPGNISSHRLKEALSFCGSGITGFFLGSSSSIAFVEFETEDAKERAIAEYSIPVLGERVLIFRIDVPRTTVVRISNINPKSLKRLPRICNSYGQVKKIVNRGCGLTDVHFKLVEWPNMCRILNSLNGLGVDGNRWLAQPAPVFPPAILEVLWSSPEERRHVKAAIDGLLRKLERPKHLDKLNELVVRYYGKIDFE